MIRLNKIQIAKYHTWTNILFAPFIINSNYPFSDWLSDQPPLVLNVILHLMFIVIHIFSTLDKSITWVHTRFTFSDKRRGRDQMLSALCKKNFHYDNIHMKCPFIYKTRLRNYLFMYFGRRKKKQNAIQIIFALTIYNLIYFTSFKS